MNMLKQTQTTDEFPVRTKMITGFVALALLVIGGGWWSVTTQIAGAVVGQGRVRVEQQRQPIQHPDGGVVQDVIVQEGDQVERNALLIRLDPTFLNAELDGLTEQRHELVARQARLEAERDGNEVVQFPEDFISLSETDKTVGSLIISQTRLFETRKITLANTIAQMQNRKLQVEIQLNGLDAQQTSIERQLELLGQELETQQGLLDRGLAQAGTVLALQREEARLWGSVGELNATASKSREQIAELDLEVLRLTNQHREDAISERSQVRYDLILLNSQILNVTERLQRLNLHAPVSGIVHGLTVFAPRTVIRPADEVMALIPQDRPLVFEVDIEPIHIDQVYFGQEATLRFPAFNANDSPELFGTVSKISADSFTHESTGASFYRAEVALNPGEASRLPEGIVLLPGMPVETYIRTSDRTPFVYLTKPLADYFNRAFRED
ncbi:HlyD family type I secretion periplasmic adaptor subunit [Halocynthiibacter namhaensis]|uniref:HlyD family type I secretion periplasmic adaptor subunit n=1 Tax=Halocynthiibacter namhaensis TaxID=1290553 RepID=UPI000AFA5B82|nr:HlyD family type I secretion periplasmic adaptor subunit [Halocynthiibacter namhaensis]